MKMNVKGLVFVGFAAAVFAGAANAADKIVTSKSYVDAKVVNSMAGNQEDAAPSVAAVKGKLADYATTEALGTAAAVDTTETITQGGTGVPTAGAVYSYVSTAGGNFQSVPGANDGQKVAKANGGWEALDVDTTVTANSSKPVTSGAVATALGDYTTTANLAPVATSGAYSDLTGTPTLGTASEKNLATAINSTDTGVPTAQQVNTAITSAISGASGDYATAAQGAKADTAVQTITTGTTAGTIAVDGTDIAVKDLKTVATSGSYNDLTNKPTLGTASEKNLATAINSTDTGVPTAQQVNTAITSAISGASGDYATAAQGAKADTAVQSVTTGDSTTGVGSIKVDGTGVTVYGLGDAAAKGVATTVTANGTDLPTAGAVDTAISDAIADAVKISVPAPATGKCGTGAPCALVLENGTATWETIQQASAN